MALKNVKTNASGAAHRGRYVTREEAKDGARHLRRVEDEFCACGSRIEDCFCDLEAAPAGFSEEGWS